MPKTDSPTPPDPSKFWEDLGVALTTLHAHFSKMGWRGTLSGTPTNAMTLMVPTVGQLTIRVVDGYFAAVSKNSQMVRADQSPYQVIVSISVPGSGTLNKSAGLAHTTPKAMADTIIEVVSAATKGD